jgi:hypothetical protein
MLALWAIQFIDTAVFFRVQCGFGLQPLVADFAEGNRSPAILDGLAEYFFADKRKPRRSGALQTVSLTSISLRRPGRILRVRVVALRFLRDVHVK